VAQTATSTCVEQTRVDGYAPRRPEDTLLHALVSEHWPRFRERAEAHGGLPKFVEEEFDAYLRCGILEHGFVQLADSALRLNVHFHTLALDGVYVRDEAGELQFRELGEPTEEEVAQVAGWTHVSLLRVLKQHGRSMDGLADTDAFASDQPVLASCYGASAADLQLLGAAAGRKTAKLVRPLRVVQGRGSSAVAEVGGVNIHAAVAVDGRAPLATRTPVPLHCAAAAFPRAP